MKPFNNIAVSPTEPENKADVWIKHAENIFDKSQAKFINGYFNTDSTNIVTSSVSKCLYLEIEGNKEYCITKKASARFNAGTTSEVPNVGVNLIDNAKNVTTTNEQKNASQIILKASQNAKYMVIWYYASNVDTLSEDEILNSIIISFNIVDDIKALEGENYVSVSPIQVSATEPRSKVWIKHNYIKYNGGWQNITYGTSGEVQSNSKRLASDKIKLEKGVYKLDNPNNEEISPVAIAKFNEDSFVELKANIKFPYELVIDDTFNQISVIFKKANETVITSGDVKNFEILSLQEDDILVNDNGVYVSILQDIKNRLTALENQATQTTQSTTIEE